MAKLEITLVRSLVGAREDQRVTVRTLGLNKIRQTVIHDDTPHIRGMIHKVRHLVSVRETA